MKRRQFLAGAIALSGSPLLAVKRQPGTRVKLGLNAYSFDKPLRAGSMTLIDVVHFCAEHRVDAVDVTGYYFPGYPKVPSDEYIYELKKTAFLNGVTISGTGVRNDFAVSDAAARQSDVRMVKEWIEVASKLGAPVIRVFSGRQMPEGHTFNQVLEWMIPEFQECAAYGERHGVIVGLQQHNDFLKTADETIRVVKAVNSEWFGDILDIGSLRTNEVYGEIEKLMPYAVSWQLKELVGIGGKDVPTDLRRVRGIIDKVGYRGFLPIETLGAGDPGAKVAKFLEQVREAFSL
ncbi:MAG: Xylose isomerase domain protein barrel [Bryobacterales bacterium]|nr:Xylose isomerase domain protein barrel [Bryobacterales bacterium]